MCLAVFDRDSLAKLSPPRWRGRALPELMLEWLVRGNGDLAASPGAGIGALRAQWTNMAGGRGKLDGGVECEALLFTRRARDRSVTHVDLERVLAEVLAILRNPWAAHDQPSACANFVDDGCVDVATVDVELVDLKPLRCDVDFERQRRIFFRTVGREHRDRQDEGQGGCVPDHATSRTSFRRPAA